MLWILPINLPTLVVWIHNLTVHWLTPFSSHHNVLSILPFVLLVETLSTGKMLPRLCPSSAPATSSKTSTGTASATTTSTKPRSPSPSSYLNRTTTPPRLAHHITSILFFALAAYAGLYGVTYAYLLHFIVNGCAAWLMLVYYACGRERGIKGVTDLLENSGGEGIGNGSGSGDGEKREIKEGSVGGVGGVGSVGNGLEDVNGGGEVEESVSGGEDESEQKKKESETRAVGSLGRGREKGRRHSHAKKEP